MNTQIKREAEQLMDYLSLPDAVAKLGAIRCQTERILIQLSLSSVTQLEAEQRLQKQIANLKKTLGV